MSTTTRTREVRSFGPEHLPEVPDLAGLQKASFSRFLQQDKRAGTRDGIGLEGLLREAFKAQSGLTYHGYDLGPEDLSTDDCLRFGRTFGAQLQLHLTGKDGQQVQVEAGLMPLMTKRGTFIIDGEEKVVIGCLQADEDTDVNDLTKRKLLLVGDQLIAALGNPVAADVAGIGENLSCPGIATAVSRFFAKSRYVKRAETRNPLSLASQLRLVVQAGVERTPGYLARCPHHTHWGRLGLLETPEGERIGINLTTAIFADLDDTGRILTPFRSAEGTETRLLPPEADTDHVIGDLMGPDERARYGDGVLARVGDDLHCVDNEKVDLFPIHPQQELGIASALIPFIAHDDANRALMGANMEKQAMPLLKPQVPLVQTGLEGNVVRDMDAADEAGVVDGCLAIGSNLLTAYMCWEGYNFEDGVVISQEVIDQQLLDTIVSREFTVSIDCQGSDVLDSDSLAVEGMTLQSRDVVISRQSQNQAGEMIDSSVRMPRGFSGKVTKVEHFCQVDGHPLAEGVAELVRVQVESVRPLQIGDKLSSRHGAKGVVTKIVPTEEMPVLPDGRRVQAIMNPLGVPSRMNIGILMETHTGMAADKLGVKVVTPGFWGAGMKDVKAMLAEAGLPESGMFQLRDGKTGRPFDRDVTVGFLYLLRLDHMVADKRQERSTGAYDSDTCQPVSGRRNGGGQRVGLMETWALQGHRASHILREMLTIKSDDVAARDATREALINDTKLPEPTVPESVKILVDQLRGLCLDLILQDNEVKALDLQDANTHIGTAATASLKFADSDTVREWSTGELSEMTGLANEIRHIALAAPVKHAWRSMLSDSEQTIPEIALLPVIPRALRGGRRLDEAYADVLAANSQCRENGLSPELHDKLQQAVDQLLNALTKLLYGKKGWITAAISGKVVDYSARSVVCPGPELDYNTCSLPTQMAIVLFEPFVIGELLRQKVADTEEQASQLLQDRDSRAMSALTQVMKEKYVLLHRAPTLHRIGIQAFRAVAADEEVIRIHPLTPIAFNADFDGDEMDVYLPLSEDAQREAAELVISEQCQLSPANGSYVAMLSQDMVLGCYYATCGSFDRDAGKGTYESTTELRDLYERGEIGIHDSVIFGDRETTVGHVLFNSLLPNECDWVEGPTAKAGLRDLLTGLWLKHGAGEAAQLADRLMKFGFHISTLSGLSLGMESLKQVSNYDKRLTAAWKRASGIVAEAVGGTNHQSACSELSAHWMAVLRGMTDAALKELAHDQDGLNALHIMVASGARGSQTQVRQHIAMRGLMSRPDNQIMRSPVTTSFYRGHSPLEYFASTYGARRGLADTSLKTSEAGFLFKRIMNAVQDVVIVMDDCGTHDGIVKKAVQDDSRNWLTIGQRIIGRTVAVPVKHPGSGQVLLQDGRVITAADAASLETAGIEEVVVRSSLTCQAENGVCASCYGLDLSTWKAPVVGQTVGVVAAQSIGEPAAQLTMRTFHVAVPPKCEPTTRRSVRPDILGGFPRLTQLLEAWTGKYAGNEDERADALRMFAEAGPEATAEYLLVEMQKVYCEQGVRIDDRHFEIVISRMIRNGLQGITDAAATEENFLVAGSVYGGIPTLAKCAAKGNEIPLSSVRACTAFGKLLP